MKAELIELSTIVAEQQKELEHLRWNLEASRGAARSFCKENMKLVSFIEEVWETHPQIEDIANKHGIDPEIFKP